MLSSLNPIICFKRKGTPMDRRTCNKEKTLNEIYFDWLVKIENAWKSGVATYISKDESIAIMWLQRFMDVTGWYELGGNAPTNHSGSYE